MPSPGIHALANQCHSAPHLVIVVERARQQVPALQGSGEQDGQTSLRWMPLAKAGGAKALPLRLIRASQDHISSSGDSGGGGSSSGGSGGGGSLLEPGVLLDLRNGAALEAGQRCEGGEGVGKLHVLPGATSQASMRLA